MNQKIKHFTKGFTLIELLVVVSIISILSTLAFVSFTAVQKRGRDSQRKSDVQQLRSALESYFANNNIYPLSIPSGNWSVGGIVYMRKVPTDPTTSTAYSYTPYKDNLITICSGGDTCITYKLIACLENNSDLQKDTVNVCAGGLVSYTVASP